MAELLKGLFGGQKPVASSVNDDGRLFREKSRDYDLELIKASQISPTLQRLQILLQPQFQP